MELNQTNVTHAQPSTNNEWPLTTIGEIAVKVGSGSTPRGGNKVYVREGHPFIRSQNVGWGELLLSDLAYIDEGTHNQFLSTEIVEGDVLLNITGASIGRGAIADDRISGGNVNQHVCIIRTSGNKLNSQFLLHYLLSEDGQKQIDSFQAGGNRQGLNFQQIRSFYLPHPSLNEQVAVANVLSDVDALLAKLDQLIAKKSDIKKGAMHELLTGKRRLPGFSGDWNEKGFGELFSFSGGYSASRADLSHKGHCYLHYGDIHLSEKTYIDLASEQADIPKLDIALNTVSKASLLEDGDVVFVDASEDDDGVSKHVVIENPQATPFISGLHTIVAKSKTGELDNSYKRFCFQTGAVKEQFKFFAVGTKVSGISKTNIAKIRLRFPGIEEQSAIAAVLSDMEAEISELKSKHAKMADIKQGMMQQLLTGKIRLV